MGDFMNRGKNLGTGFKNRGPVIEGGSFTNRGAEDQPGREFKNRGQAWFGGAFKNRGQTALESSAAWSPAALFAASEVGAWYDPSDLSTLYQDSEGVTAVTAVGQYVGLMLDKSKGLSFGSELVVNGDFSNGTIGWSATNSTLSAANNQLTITSTANYGIGASTGFTTVVGRFYKATAKLVSCSSATARIRKTDNASNFNASPVHLINGGTWSAGQIFTVYFRATATTTYIMGVTDTHPSNMTISNVSVKELPGNHALEATSGERPLLDTANLINFDGVDDLLTASNPDLGTDVTIARATASGVSILTGQTVGANYVDNTDHYGLVIVNRALTAEETASLTAYLEAFIP